MNIFLRTVQSKWAFVASDHGSKPCFRENQAPNGGQDSALRGHQDSMKGGSSQQRTGLVRSESLRRKMRLSPK